MTTTPMNPITEDDIANYLDNTPDFFARHAELLGAVQQVGDVDTAPVRSQGPLIEHHPRFPKRVNAGFMQIVDRGRIRLRVWERGAGETLACGTGACAAVVAGIRLGRLDRKVDVETRGGLLTIEWDGMGPAGAAPVLMTGPAVTVFEGELELPESL